MPIQIDQSPVQEKNKDLSLKLPKSFTLSRKVTDKDRMFFTEQLALLLETGSNLHLSLKTLQTQMENPTMSDVIAQMSDQVAEGKTFSHALSQHPKVFSQTYVNLIAASENGGFMHQVLEQLHEMDEKREQFQTTLSSALTYPIFLLFFAFAVVVFVLVMVFPKFGDMFTLIEDQLPATTRFFMATSEFFLNQWPFILIGLALFIMLGFTWLKSDNGQYFSDRFKLGMPGISRIFIQIYVVQIMRVMSMSLNNGVGIMETLHACKDVVNNRIFQSFITQVEKRVEEGSGIAAGFANSQYIPAIVEQMIRTGEETGNLAKVMGRLADFYERELTRRLANLSKLAEPLMLVVMGAVVGVLVSSLILPIFKLSRAVG
jgi:type II secretory pathway component PulF